MEVRGYSNVVLNIAFMSSLHLNIQIRGIKFPTNFTEMTSTMCHGVGLAHLILKPFLVFNLGPCKTQLIYIQTLAVVVFVNEFQWDQRIEKLN